MDLSLLAASKRALLGIENEIPPKEPPESGPLKIEEEVERELDKAASSLQDDGEEQQSAATANATENIALPKKLKRSRADMLRDLQNKIPAASIDTSQQTSSVEGTTSSNGQGTVSIGEPSVMKGFKAIERTDDKSSKKRKKMKTQNGNGNSPLPTVHSEDRTSAYGPHDVLIDITSLNTTTLDTEEVVPDEDIDIFAGVGTYDGLEDESENKLEEVLEEKFDNDKAAKREKYFEDQDELMPKFQAYRSPTPPARSGSQSRLDTDATLDLGTHNPNGDPSEDPKSLKPHRLEGLSSSTFSARDLLAYDDAQAHDEARKLRKLKGREKKEALAREAELSGPLAKSSEAKEKDRLNREMQEYEKFEKKKAKKGE